jgi:hypothetical protein
VSVFPFVSGFLYFALSNRRGIRGGQNILGSTNLRVNQIWGSLSFGGHSILGFIQFCGPLICWGLNIFGGHKMFGVKLVMCKKTFSEYQFVGVIKFWGPLILGVQKSVKVKIFGGSKL